jgi:hypothetical protein
MFGRCRPFATSADGIITLRITRCHSFKADIALPIGKVIVDIPEAFAPLKAKRVQRDILRVGAVAIVVTENVEMVEVFVAPREKDLDHAVELGQGGVAADQKSSPDERADAAQNDAQLIDVWVGSLLLHAQSV